MWRPLLACCVAAACGASAEVPFGTADGVALLQAYAGTGGREGLPREGVEDRPRKTGPRVLVFLAVGSSRMTMERTKRNIRHLQRTHSNINSTLYLVHYDMRRQAWLDTEYDWYKMHVDFAAEQGGFKMQVAKKILPAHLSRHKYDWIWLVDEDVDFSATNLTRMFATSSQAGVLISQAALAPQNRGLPRHVDLSRLPRRPPARLAAATSQLQLRSELTSGCQRGEVMCLLVEQHTECLYRYSDFVEVMAPIIRPDALQLVFEKCEYCIHERSVWGLDKVWCSWLARQLGRDKHTTCALLDTVTVRHDNQKTLNKWDRNGNRNMPVVAINWGALNDTQRHYPDDFVEGLGGHTLSCVKS